MVLLDNLSSSSNSSRPHSTESTHNNITLALSAPTRCSENHSKRAKAPLPGSASFSRNLYAQLHRFCHTDDDGCGARRVLLKIPFHITHNKRTTFPGCVCMLSWRHKNGLTTFSWKNTTQRLQLPFYTSNPHESSSVGIEKAAWYQKRSSLKVGFERGWSYRCQYRCYFSCIILHRVQKAKWVECQYANRSPGEMC